MAIDTEVGLILVEEGLEHLDEVDGHPLSFALLPHDAPRHLVIGHLNVQEGHETASLDVLGLAEPLLQVSKVRARNKLGRGCPIHAYHAKQNQ